MFCPFLFVQPFVLSSFHSSLEASSHPFYCQSDKHHTEESWGDEAVSQNRSKLNVRKPIYITLSLIRTIDSQCKCIKNIRREEKL